MLGQPPRRFTTRRLSAVALFVLAATACDDATQDLEAKGPVGVTAVVVDTIRGEEDGPSSLSQIRGIAVDAGGRVYVADGVEKSVKVFAADGSFLRAMGRQGQGPGEFNTPQGVAIGPEERAYVYDPQARRVVVFDSTGAFDDMSNIPIFSYGYRWEGGIDTEGRLLDQQLRRVDTSRVMNVRRVDLGSGVIDTLPQPNCAPLAPYYAFERGSASVPFSAGEYIWIDAEGGGTWCADRATANAYFFPFGDTLARDSVKSLANPMPVTGEERAVEVARLDSFALRAGGPSPDFDQIPDVKPVLTSLDRDERGRLWMTVRDSAGDAMHVFDTNGEWMARVARRSHRWRVPTAWCVTIGST